MIDWTNATHADGPAAAEWFAAHNFTDPNLMRRMREWRRGDRAYVETIDRYLTPCGYHLSELPDEIWRRDPILDLLEAGVPTREITARCGVSRWVVRYFRDRYQPVLEVNL